MKPQTSTSPGSKVGSSKPGGRFIRRLVIVGILSGAALIGWIAVGRHVAPHLATSEHYLVRTEQFEITPPPAWIKSDIRAEALREGGLAESQSILDEELLKRVTDAFALHPWVARVTSVRKYGSGRLAVDLEYRRPVCMVEVPRGLFPVDNQGVLLPSKDFVPLEASRYPRLTGIPAGTWSQVGAAWRDPRVIAATRVAEALVELWAGGPLARIVPAEPSGERGRKPWFDLRTRRQTTIVWGHAPGEEDQGEPDVASKVARLKAHLERASDSAAGAMELDLSRGDGTFDAQARRR